MEFSFTPEQEMIRDTAEGFLTDVSTSNAVRTAMDTETGFDTELWQQICRDMYWQAIHIPEQYGGLGLGYVELAILFEQMGRRLLCSPYFSTVALGINALLIAGTEAQKQQYLPQIADGSLTATLAYIGGNDSLNSAGHVDQPQKNKSMPIRKYNNGWSTDAITVTALPQFNSAAEITGYQLSGELLYVANGHTADLIIVAARLPDSTGDEGICLFILPSHTDGIKVQWTPTVDQTRPQVIIHLDNVWLGPEAVMQKAENAWPLLEKTLQLAVIAVAAEQMGGAQQVLDLTVEYTKERKQFGRTIASFQAIKHRMADMMLQVESARSAVYYAACIADEALNTEGNPIPEEHLANQFPEASSLAKAYCSDAFFHCAAESLQFHGGVGFTWEYDPHLYFKRAKSSETLLGNSAYHREKIAQVIL